MPRAVGCNKREKWGVRHRLLMSTVAQEMGPWVKSQDVRQSSFTHRCSLRANNEEAT